MPLKGSLLAPTIDMNCPWMRYRALALVVAALTSVTTACSRGDAKTTDSDAGIAELAAMPAPPAPPKAPDTLTTAEVRFYTQMAEHSLAYLETYYQPATGLVSATPEWHNTTMWDVGGQLLAYLAAKDIGLITAEEFDKRTSKTMATLEKLPLTRGAAYGKVYWTKTGAPGDGRSGWSATDLGRFFLALKILAIHEPKYAAQAERIVKRNNFKRLVKNGYMWGELTGSNGKPWAYQEGRIGYEQYMAHGFSRWGHDVAPALSVKSNAKPVDVMGVKLVADKRYQDRLLSEPFILYGVELGLTGEMRDLAESVLKVQEARFTKTGKMTMVSEDAVPIAPDYFYYYCVYCDAKPFIIQGAGSDKHLDGPRWVSTKAAFGWDALLPSAYTKQATEYVSVALDPKKGWSSGAYEDKRQATGAYDVNTAAVLLEIAAYRLRGNRPLIEP
jgi:hypothetical protein